MKVVIYVALLTFGAVVKAQQDYQDYWSNDYGNYDDYNLAVDDSNEDTEIKQAETTIDAGGQPTEAPTESDKFDDYQIEDNRSDGAEKEAVEGNKEETAEVTVAEVPASEPAVQHKVLPLEILPLEEPEQNNEDLVSKELGLDEDASDETANEDLVPLPVPEPEDNNNDNIFEETKDILNKDQDYLDEIPQAPVENDSDLDKIIEETNKLLAESDDALDAIDYSDEQAKSDEDVFSENNEEDTPAKVYADLNADLDKLFETLDKLSDDTTNEQASTDGQVTDDVKDYEEKYSKPYNEDVALSWRNAEGNDALEPKANDETADGNDNENANDLVSDEEGADDDYENIYDSNLSQIFNSNASIENAGNPEQELVELDANNEESSKETTEAPLEKNDEDKELVDYADNYDDSKDSEPNAVDDIDSVIKQIFADDVKEPQAYGDDALVDDKYKEEDAMDLDETKTTIFDEETTQKTAMIDDLNSAELDQLVSQFVAAHKEEFDVNSESFAKHVAPVHITLSVDEPQEITSPGFPERYPTTGNIIDWIFDGPGQGIEMNITDFDVHGAVGDYLLVIPGGLDNSGKDGLVFTHHLNSVKKYRFTDVNRMFVRFVINQTPWQMKQGFRFTVKLIEPLPTFADDEPVAEPVANAPEETLTLNLAGLTLPKFQEIREQFRELLADIAKEYIRDNNITLGLNTTYEVTQITRTAVCNIQWPEYENCVELTFGVPLHYEEDPEEPRLNAEELEDMWTSYITKEEFSERLRSLGITEYVIPNDRTVMMVWLVIAGGVLISMAMLAFALWRFSCFEDYTRMPTYGDTDSLQNEKRHLDLYPTPHQTLPPLYSENDYKWADDKYDDSTRVDMGGFANRNYIRDELYDLDSDEDVIAPRDRKGAFTPRDFSNA